MLQPGSAASDVTLHTRIQALESTKQEKREKKRRMRRFYYDSKALIKCFLEHLESARSLIGEGEALLSNSDTQVQQYLKYTIIEPLELILKSSSSWAKADDERDGD